ncbi:MAG: ThiF family adenylyltransferase [Oligoflexia bacterium]|nr:ThiF family adenylyltransferase [Oligoflexia bacterium]
MDLSRNLGLISSEQQERLRKASILVCGCGGMGGVCAEILARMGIGRIVLVDHDRFEPSNVNRQIHCTTASFGKLKAKVIAKELRRINPELDLTAFVQPVGLSNVSGLLSEVDVVVNAMDQMLPSICLEREARRRKIPIVDAWITPFASVFTMRHTDPHWEEFLGFPTKSKPETEITEEDCRQALRKEVDFTFSHFDPLRHVSRKKVAQVLAGRAPRPSLAPVVWLSGVLMANEAFKLILGIPEVGPAGIFYDQYTHRLMAGKLPKVKRKKRFKREVHG